jgi:hypothetical protein
MTISQQIEPHAVLWRHGSWQVRANGLCCSYREIFIQPKDLQNWTVAGNVRQQVLIRLGVDTLSYAEELDILDAFDHAVAWFGGTDKVRQVLRQSSLDPLVMPVGSQRCVEPKPRVKRSRSLSRAGLAPGVRFYVLKRDGYRCKLCGASAEDERLHVDHKIAKVRGGSDDLDNLWVLCEPCNSGKRAREL